MKPKEIFDNKQTQCILAKQGEDEFGNAIRNVCKFAHPGGVCSINNEVYPTVCPKPKTKKNDQGKRQDNRLDKIRC